jgi:hypothetical protein
VNFVITCGVNLIPTCALGAGGESPGTGEGHNTLGENKHSPINLKLL